MELVRAVAFRGLAVLVLAVSVMTFITYTASIIPVECRTDALPLINPALCGLVQYVSRYDTYFLSVESECLNFLATTCLIIFSPVLSAAVWRAVERPRGGGITVATLHDKIQFSLAPGLVKGLETVRSSGFPALSTCFVIMVTTLSLASSFTASAIFKHNVSGYSGTYNWTVGGGVGWGPGPTWTPDYRMPGGLEAGNALVNALSAQHTPWNPTTYDVSVLPMMVMADVFKIYSAVRRVVPVIYTQLDCNSPATLEAAHAVALGGGMWESSANGSVLSTGVEDIGTVLHYTELATLYVNSSNSTGPGWVTVNTTVLFLAVNGTIEGSQASFPSPDSSSTQINNVDLLVCLSTATIRLSTCQINKGNVTSCDALATNELPSSVNTSDGQGGLTSYMSSPIEIALIVAAGPPLSLYSEPDVADPPAIPMYDLIQLSSNIHTGLPPPSFIGRDASNSYHIPLDYVRLALFQRTQYILVQGVMDRYMSYSPEPAMLSVTFATSEPWLQLVVICVTLSVAAIAVLSSTLLRSSREAQPLSLARLLTISRGSHELDDVFTPYANRRVPIPAAVQNTKLAYEHVESGHLALALAAGADNTTEGAIRIGLMGRVDSGMSSEDGLAV